MTQKEKNMPNHKYEGKLGKMVRKVSDMSFMKLVKFIYSEKATKFCEIFPLLLTTVHTVKSKGKILQNSVAFSEYMNFTTNDVACAQKMKNSHK